MECITHMYKCFNQAVIDELRAIMGPDLVKLYQTYQRDTRTRLAEMKQARADGNAEAYKLAAHSLLGTSANVGAQTIHDLCSAIEQHLADSNTEGAFRVLDPLYNAYLQLLPELEQLASPD